MNRRRSRRFSALVWFVAFGLAAAGGTSCSSSPSPPTGADASAEPEVTYHADVAPIVEENCADCHGPGDIGGLVLTNYEDFSTAAEIALGKVEAGEMPPWPPDESCRDLHGSREIADDEIATLQKWVDAGKPEGDPDTAPADTADKSDKSGESEESGAPTSLFDQEPDRVADIAAPYTPREDLDDDYHCFMLDETFDETTFMVGSDVRPDVNSLVHHATIYLVYDYQTDKVTQLENDHDGPGYPCFGTPGFNSITLVGAWVPGAQPMRTPEGTAAVIPEGSRLVMQTHFNTLYADPEPVEPSVELYTTDDTPEKEVRAKPFANLGIEIPPGAEDSTHEQSFQNYSDEPWTIIGAALHMHLFGSSGKLTIERKDGGETCLLDIPDWDFDWQQMYRFAGGPAKVDPGDAIELTCSYDNSADNQPVVDGEPKDVERVTWGPGSTEEMCIGFAVALQDYEPRNEEICAEYTQCRQSSTTCTDDPYSIGCLFNCAVNAQNKCTFCLVEEAQNCAGEYCESELDTAYPCVRDCGLANQDGGDFDGCLEEKCPQKKQVLEDCLRPHLKNGDCKEELSECNASFDTSG